MNGGGMENFIEEIVASYPELPVINASEGIEFLASEHEHDHSHSQDDLSNEDELHDEDELLSEDEEHDEAELEEISHEEEFNAHVWLNMDYYRIQLENVKDGIINYIEDNTDEFEANAKEYDNKIVDLKKEYETTLMDIAGNEVVIFHDAFAYLAQQLGLEVVYTINMDNETSLSAGEIALVVDEVNKHNIEVLFTEEQYSANIPQNIANETDAKEYVIDSVDQGSFDADGYLDAMNYNLEVLKEAFLSK